MTQSSDGAPTPALRTDTSPTVTSTAATGTLGPQPVSERCDHCGAPVDAAQRYCVQCGAHQRRANDPTARWFASARRAKAEAALPAAVVGGAAGGRTIPAGVAAVLIALLPLSAGVGVVVGRQSDDSGKQVIEALKAANARGVATGAAVGAAAGANAANAAAADDAAEAVKTDDSGPSKKVSGVDVGTKEAPIIGNGARKLADTKPTAKDLAQSKQAVKDINSKKGSDYVKAQADLPDTITVP